MALLDDKGMSVELHDGLKMAGAAARASLEETVAKQTTKLRAGTKTRKSAATRERIMAAATDLMVERGNTDFQMSEVSARCNMSKGALYYYFSDKSALVEAIFDRSIDDLVDSIEGVVSAAPSATASMEGLAYVFTSRLSSKSPLTLAMTRELLDSHSTVLPSVETYLARCTSIVAAQLERAKEEGVVRRDVDARLAAVSVTGAFIFAAMEEPLLSRSHASSEDLGRQLLDLAFDGMGTEKARNHFMPSATATPA